MWIYATNRPSYYIHPPVLVLAWYPRHMVWIPATCLAYWRCVIQQTSCFILFLRSAYNEEERCMWGQYSLSIITFHDIWDSVLDSLSCSWPPDPCNANVTYLIIVIVLKAFSFSHWCTRCTQWPDKSAHFFLLISTTEYIIIDMNVYIYIYVFVYFMINILKHIWVRPCSMPSLAFYNKSAEYTKLKVGLVQSIVNWSRLGYVLPRKMTLNNTCCHNVAKLSAFNNTVLFCCARSTVSWLPLLCCIWLALNTCISRLRNTILFKPRWLNNIQCPCLWNHGVSKLSPYWFRYWLNVLAWSMPRQYVNHC